MNQDIEMHSGDGSDGVRHDSAVVRRPANAHAPIVARRAVNIRAGTMADLPLIDRMQKAHSRELGFLPTKALEGKVALGQVLIAEAVRGDCGLRTSDCGLVVKSGHRQDDDILQSEIRNPRSAIGYLIAADRYQKRDEIGYVTQLCVVPDHRRGLVAAQLLQAQFDRSAYGCRLYGCWCAQDLKANEFWEAMGFVPIAFRTGARGKLRSADRGVRNEKTASATTELRSAIRTPKSAIATARMHIFWQKRIRAGDTTTPWWYPSQTGGGELREDRLVFPIPPGVHWRDVLPVMLPTEPQTTPMSEPTGIHEAQPPKPRRASSRKAVKPVNVDARRSGGLWFLEDEPAAAPATELAKPAKPPKAKAKIDPRLTAMARELRDRWTEQADLILPPPAPHDVRRMIGHAAPEAAPTIKALPKVTALPSAA